MTEINKGVSRTLLMETKSIIGHAVYTMRNPNSTEMQKDSAIDNLVACMCVIEDFFVQGFNHDQIQKNDQDLSAAPDNIESPTSVTELH